MEQRKEISAGTALLPILTVLVLLPQLAGLGHGFYLDDLTWFFALFRGWGSFWKILAPWKPNDVRSLGQLLFYLQYLVFGLHPLGFNAVSLLLHWGCSYLVGRLAMLSGLTGKQSFAAALVFCAGLGHYTKPMTWACAQALELATLFLLGSVLAFLSSRESAGKEERFPTVPLVLFGLALLSHEIVFLGFVGLAFLAYQGRQKRWWLVGAAGLLEAALYGLATLRAHTGHPVASGGGSGPLLNLFYFPAAYLLPVQTLAVLRPLLSRAGAAAAPGALAAPLGILAGAVVLAGLALLARRSSPVRRALLLFALFAFLPVLPMPMPAGWVEVRYLYPMSAFLAPVLVGGIAGAWGRLSPWLRPLVCGLLILWGGVIYAGSLYMQKQASDLANMPATRRGWELVKAARPGPARLAAPAAPGGAGRDSSSSP